MRAVITSPRGIPLAWWWNESTLLNQSVLTVELCSKRYSLWVVHQGDVTPLEYHQLDTDLASNYVDHTVKPAAVFEHMRRHPELRMPEIAWDMIVGQWLNEQDDSEGYP